MWQSADWLELLLVVGVAAGASSLVGSLVAVARRRRERVDVPRLHRTPAIEGHIYCNYVDAPALTRLARDLGVPIEPVRVELQEGRRRSRRLGLQFGRVRGDADSEDSRSRTAVYDFPFDPESLTLAVLEDLIVEERIQMGLGHARSAALTQGRVLVELLSETKARFADVPPDLTERLQEVAVEAVASEKEEQFRYAAEHRAYALIEGTWHVSQRESGAILELAQLNAGHGQFVPMPSGLSVEVPIRSRQPAIASGTGLTARGEQRLRGEVSVVAASVLGNPESFEGGHLLVTPIVVFDRVGGRSLDPPDEIAT